MDLHFKPPLNTRTARARVQAEQDAWNSRDPEVVARTHSIDATWRYRDEIFAGREAIKGFLKRKWSKELHYRLSQELWAFTKKRICVRFEYEWQNPTSGQWFRTHGNGQWELDDDGYICLRDVSASDIPISADERRLGIAATSHRPKTRK